MRRSMSSMAARKRPLELLYSQSYHIFPKPVFKLSSRNFTSLQSPESANTLKIASQPTKTDHPKYSVPQSWDKVTERLFNPSSHPVGSFTPANWREAELALKQTIKGDTQSVQRAFKLLDRLLLEKKDVDRLESKARNFFLQVDVLNWVLTCWKDTLGETRDNTTIGISLESCWNIIQNYAIEGLVHCNGISYSIIIDAIGKVEEPKHAPEKAEELLRGILEMNEILNSVKSFPNAFTINPILNLWLKSGHPEANIKVDALLYTLKEWHHQRGLDEMLPTNYTYATIISTWTKTCESNNPVLAARRAEELLQEAIESRKEDMPNGVVYSAVCCALAKAGQADRAHELMNETMKKIVNYNANSDNSIEDASERQFSNETLSYTIASVLEAYGKLGQVDVMEKLIEEVSAISQLRTGTGPSSQTTNFGLNNVCYNILINAYAIRGLYEKAEAAMKHMKEVSRLEVDISVWNGIMVAYANSGSAAAAEKVEAIINALESKSADCKPNTISYNILLNCFAQGNGNSTSLANAEKAQALLKRMEMQDGNVTAAPDAISHGAVLKAWCKAGEPQVAESLLQRMHLNFQKKESSVAPTTDHFATVMDGWAEKLKNKKDLQAMKRIEALFQAMQKLRKVHGYNTKPDTVTCNIFLNCLSYSKSANVPERAEALVQQMLRDFQSGDNNLKPDEITVNSLLSVWLRSNRKDASQRVRKIFRAVEESGIAVNSFSYTTMMAIDTRVGNFTGAERLFAEMQKRYAGGEVYMKPSFHSYVTLLQARAKAGDPEGAASVLSEIISRYEGGDSEFRPNTPMFNAVLKSWLKSRRQDASEKAVSGLHMMETLSVGGRFQVLPDLISYTTVIASYSFSRHPNAKTRALQLFEKMKTSLAERISPNRQPDLQAYATLIGVLLKPISHGDEIVDQTDEFNRLLNEIRHIPDAIWKEQGFLFCQRVLNSIDRSDVDGKAKLVDDLRNLADQFGIIVNERSVKN